MKHLTEYQKLNEEDRPKIYSVADKNNYATELIEKFGSASLAIKAVEEILRFIHPGSDVSDLKNVIAKLKFYV